MIKNTFFVGCQEANIICDKGQYNEASFWEKIKLNIHLAYCKGCQLYSKNNGKLTKLFKKSNAVTLQQNEKEKMKEQLRDLMQ